MDMMENLENAPLLIQALARLGSFKLFYPCCTLYPLIGFIRIIGLTEDLPPRLVFVLYPDARPLASTGSTKYGPSLRSFRLVFWWTDKIPG